MFFLLCRMADRSKEELRAGIQTRMRMMMAQKETIERELLKLQVRVRCSAMVTTKKGS